MNTEPTIAAPYGPLERLSSSPAPLAAPSTQGAPYGHAEPSLVVDMSGTRKRRNERGAPRRLPNADRQNHRHRHEQQQRRDQRREQEVERITPGVNTHQHPSEPTTSAPQLNQPRPESTRQTTSGALDPLPRAVAGRVAKASTISCAEAPLSDGPCPLVTEPAGLLGARQLEGQLAQPAVDHYRRLSSSTGGGSPTTSDSTGFGHPVSVLFSGCFFRRGACS